MPQTASKNARAVQRQTARPRIVSVEDDEDVQEVLRTWLSRDYDLVVLPHGEDLIDEVQLLQPDLVMLDIGLPGPDGLLLCQRLRRLSRLATVPILIFSGRQDDEAFLSSVQAGASSFLLKPVTKEELLGRLSELLER
ncbi:response regulator [bacterium]|nr:MAG: response regulator [bacterium]